MVKILFVLQNAGTSMTCDRLVELEEENHRLNTDCALLRAENTMYEQKVMALNERLQQLLSTKNPRSGQLAVVAEEEAEGEKLAVDMEGPARGSVTVTGDYRRPQESGVVPPIELGGAATTTTVLREVEEIIVKQETKTIEVDFNRVTK